MGKTECHSGFRGDVSSLLVDNVDVVVRVKKGWTKIPPKTVHIVLQRNSCIPIIEEWKKIQDGELNVEKSIYVNSLINRIKERGRL